MKKAIVFIFVGMLLIQPKVSIAQSYAFNRAYKQTPLEQVLAELETYFDIKFSYVNKVVRKTNFSAVLKGNTLDDAIKTLETKLNLEFSKVDERVIVITKANVQNQVQQMHVFRGRVLDSETGEGVPGVNIITLPIAQYGTITDQQGHYAFNLPEGYHEIRFSFVGFQTHVEKTSITQDQSFDLRLSPDFRQLSSVEINPGSFEIDAVSAQNLTLTKEEVLHSPAPFRDVYRTLKIIPGYANDDISAKPRVRGGHWDETAIFLDNFEIYEPSHLEEVEGLASIFDTDIIQGVKVLTGGFGPKYTDKLSGIIELRTPSHIERDETSFSIDFLAAKATWKKSFNAKTNAMVHARRGYLDLILDTEEVGLSPAYYDIFAKVNHTINDRHQLSFDVLYAQDVLGFNETRALLRPEFYDSKRKNLYAWTNWKWMPSDNFYSQTTFGYQSLVKDSEFAFESSLTPDNVDDRDTKILSLNNRNYFDGLEKHSIEFGLEVKLFDAEYHFSESRVNTFLTTQDFIWTEILNVNSQFSGFTIGLYFQDTWSVSDKLRFMYGARLSHQDYTGEWNLGPRFALNYELSQQLNASLAYGIYYQPDNFQKVRSYVGQSVPFGENAKSTHYTANLTYTKKNTQIRANFFFKDNERLWDDFRYDFYNMSSLAALVELPFNATHGESKGFEIYARHTFEKNLLSLSYTNAESKIFNASGESTFRDYDYRHTLSFNSIFRLKNNYSLSGLWSYHTGGPYTPSTVQFIGEPRFNSDARIYFDFGTKNSARLPDYHSLDIKIEKVIYAKKFTFTFYLSMINLYSNQNIRNFYWATVGENEEGNAIVERSWNTGPDFFVSPGIIFTF